MAKKPVRDVSDENDLRDIGTTLRLHGVESREGTQGPPRDTPSHEKQGWAERGRVRDLTVEKDGQPEAIRQTHMTWGERLKAQRSQASERGEASQAQEGAEKPRSAGQTKEHAAPTASPQKAGWVDRGKANGLEGEQAEKTTTTKENAGKAKKPERAQGKDHENER